ncbi:uncharacterized protein LOC113492837 isoform X2 [Trichoplusia ni]|uniref:Uncharacterized protein LOC113492837 isoform X2 n=1 Tax=Trichoplusia ni TaxID=7111 RepID=A0A7E5VDF0_TRINI|nr:uncharacterized protein LOC113492837 isoform X2 [Trichoplusia ni]
MDAIQPDPKPIKKIEEPENVTSNETDLLAHCPTGQGFRGEVFQNKSAVHLPFLEFVHRGHCHLKITKDYMQTAVNAFAIFIAGNLDDILRLPSLYVLHSARTIAMMKIAREKMAATWSVVKGSTPTEAIPYETLERYRPLFKYLNGKEMAKLNLSDSRILSYIGTHPDLSRHQVGVVASRYIQINPRWTEPKYLNMMNNLLCGVPMIFMRRIPENTYLQLTHQIFYHIRACDPLQRRFYLAMMMRTQALGKSYSWSAREVSRLGLLLAEVSGQDLSAINPEAMSGITAQVMLEMPIHSLKSITEMQLRYLEPKPLNILARKLIAYQNQQLAASGVHIIPSFSLISIHYILFYLISIILLCKLYSLCIILRFLRFYYRHCTLFSMHVEITSFQYTIILSMIPLNYYMSTNSKAIDCNFVY